MPHCGGFPAAYRGPPCGAEIRIHVLSGAPVVGRPAELGQLGGEMAHRGKKQLDPLFLRPDMDRLLAHLGYPKEVRARVEPPEQAGITIELIPQYQAEMAHAHFGAASPIGFG